MFFQAKTTSAPIVFKALVWRLLARKTSKSQFKKVTIEKYIVELWEVTSNKMIKYQLPYTRLHQISDNKHDIIGNKAKERTSKRVFRKRFSEKRTFLTP